VIFQSTTKNLVPSLGDWKGRSGCISRLVGMKKKTGVRFVLKF